MPINQVLDDYIHEPSIKLSLNIGFSSIDVWLSAVFIGISDVSFSDGINSAVLLLD